MSCVDVSIVTYHTDESELRKCLDVLLAETTVRRVHVVDNSSMQYIAVLCAECGDRVTYTPHPNTGYGDAHNVAIRQSIMSGATYHLVINSDVYFNAGALDVCVEYMNSHADVAQLIPHTVYPDGREQYVIHPLPTPFDMALRGFLPEKWFASRRRRYILADRDPDATVNAPYHHGCFMLLRVSALTESGLFDPRFFMYPEDIDLTRRLHRRYRTVYYPGTTIVHAHRAESKTSWKMRKVHVVNMLRYFRKWGFFFDSERRRMNRELFRSLGYENL
ncbi:MAG: glycosyltransferase [Muribaculaceae bacterium]|nr:glycosyltransferase [Muribaculaceae bacterium]